MSSFALKNLTTYESLHVRNCTAQDINNIFYCPFCYEPMILAAYGSTKKSPYFRCLNKHKEGCILYNSTTTAPYKLDTSTLNLNQFYSNLLTASPRNTPTTSSCSNPSRSFEVSNSEVKPIRTLRELFIACKNTIPNAIIAPHLKTEDIICDARTCNIITLPLNGIKLVEAQYQRYNKEAMSINALCPINSTGKKFELTLTFRSYALYKLLKNDLYSVGEKTTFALLAFWRNNTCIVESNRQIIYLKIGKKEI